MEYSINIPEVESDKLKLVVPKFFGKTKLLYNGTEVKETNNRYSINTENDKLLLITLKNNYLDPIPKVLVNDNPIQVAMPIRWFEYVWMGLPILLILQGGLLGALFGFIALRLNINIFRNSKNVIAKYSFTLLISLVFAIVYILIAIVVAELIKQ